MQNWQEIKDVLKYLCTVCLTVKKVTSKKQLVYKARKDDKKRIDSQWQSLLCFKGRGQCLTKERGGNLGLVRKGGVKLGPVISLVINNRIRTSLCIPIYTGIKLHI